MTQAFLAGTDTKPSPCGEGFVFFFKRRFSMLWFKQWFDHCRFCFSAISFFALDIRTQRVNSSMAVVRSAREG